MKSQTLVPAAIGLGLGFIAGWLVSRMGTEEVTFTSISGKAYNARMKSDDVKAIKSAAPDFFTRVH